MSPQIEALELKESYDDSDSKAIYEILSKIAKNKQGQIVDGKFKTLAFGLEKLAKELCEIKGLAL